MISLNLITEESKKSVKNRRAYLLFLQIEIIFIVLIIITGAIIFSTEKILATNIYQANQETTKLLATVKADYESKASAINEKMNTVAQIEHGYVSYSQILRDVISLLPANVSLSYLNVDGSNNAIKIRGLAPTRDDLLNLEKNLNGAPWLVKVNVPLEEEFNKANINFDIDLVFDLSKLPS